MKTYAIVTPNGFVSGWLAFQPSTESGLITLNKDCPISEVSPLLRVVREMHGRFELTQHETDLYIAERVCPPEREGLDAILRRWGLDHYNPYLLTIALSGRAVCDNDHFEEV